MRVLKQLEAYKREPTLRPKLNYKNMSIIIFHKLQNYYLSKYQKNAANA